ncbi:MAG: M23 family metallopeptidase [Deltaproteobacteria bacterium]|nr:MAG: M23 family metallopeptidase [Deltaproteobacteria bacterium]
MKRDAFITIRRKSILKKAVIIKDSKGGAKLVLIILLIIVIPMIVFLVIRFEGAAPVISCNLPSPAIGLIHELKLNIADESSGLRNMRAVIRKDGIEILLLEKDYPADHFIMGGTVTKDPVRIRIEPRKLKISDGKVLLQITARDYSWRNFWNGNPAKFEQELWIDTKPPEINVLTKAHNINQGGCGLAIYQINEDLAEGGVMAGDIFFPGYAGYFSDKKIHLCFFALEYQKGLDTEMYILAVDQAGNKAKSRFPHYIRKKKFKEDTLAISDHFLNSTIAGFEIPEEFKPSQLTLVDKFLKINRELRKQNTSSILEPGKNSDKVMYWEGIFLRLPNSAPRAGFADHRIYKYNGQTIDRQVHLGVDLASLAQSEVPAANKGKVVFTGYVGIYGNTVVVDHGFGIFSVYSHLSRISVEVGKIVEKGEVLGKTGETGLAAGDHLHFAMFVNNVFVNPIEWWDASWIENNITSKIKDVESSFQAK